MLKVGSHTERREIITSANTNKIGVATRTEENHSQKEEDVLIETMSFFNRLRNLKQTQESMWAAFCLDQLRPRQGG